jgi:glutaminyl-peptide cyclotransferase
LSIRDHRVRAVGYDAGMVSTRRRFSPGLLLATVAATVVIAASVCAKPTTRLSTVTELRLKVVRTYPHDSRAFTQGLLMFDGKLYEGTGLYGRSAIRRVDLTSGMVEQQAPLPSDLFGEGVARVGQRLIQLTWKGGKALVWDLGTLTKVAEFSYEGEGWGLCFDGKRLVMSDGSDRLAFRDPTNFQKQGEIRVRRDGKPLTNLNELECVGGIVYANVWQDEHIARIDPSTGDVTGWIDASGLDRSSNQPVDVLNGIAVMEGTGNLLVTGKLWPNLYEVQIVSAKKEGSR